MTLYLVVPVLIVVAVFQASALPHLAIWGVFPDLPLLLVVCWGLLSGAREGLLWGFVAGLALDLLSGAPFGAATLSLMAVGALAGWGESAVVRAQLLFPLLTMFVATFVFDLVLLLIVRVSGQSVAWIDSLLRVILPSAALNAILTPLVFWILRWLKARLVREEMGI